MPASKLPHHGFHCMKFENRRWQAIRNQHSVISAQHSTPALHFRSLNRWSAFHFYCWVGGILLLLGCDFCCVAIAWLFLLCRGLLLNVANDIASIHVTHVDVGHPHVVFFQERCCNRVLFFEQLVGVLNDLRQPLPAADVDYTQQIWPDLVSMSDGMARDTISSEQIFALIEVFQRASVSRTSLLSRVIVLEIIEKIANHPGLKTGIVQGGTAHPLADCLITDQEMGNMAICIHGRGGIYSQPLAQKNNVLFLPRQKGPARPHMKLLHVSPQYFWCVVLRINANGIKKDIFAYSVTQLLLHLRQARRFKRTCVVARGVNEIDGDDLALDQIVIEMDPFSVLSDELDVGEVA